MSTFISDIYFILFLSDPDFRVATDMVSELGYVLVLPRSSVRLGMGLCGELDDRCALVRVQRRRLQLFLRAKKTRWIFYSYCDASAGPIRWFICCCWLRLECALALSGEVLRTFWITSWMVDDVDWSGIDVITMGSVLLDWRLIVVLPLILIGQWMFDVTPGLCMFVAWSMIIWQLAHGVVVRGYICDVWVRQLIRISFGRRWFKMLVSWFQCECWFVSRFSIDFASRSTPLYSCIIDDPLHTVAFNSLFYDLPIILQLVWKFHCRLGFPAVPNGKSNTVEMWWTTAPNGRITRSQVYSPV
jgi:hypothetical protein